MTLPHQRGAQSAKHVQRKGKSKGKRGDTERHVASATSSSLLATLGGNKSQQLSLAASMPPPRVLLLDSTQDSPSGSTATANEGRSPSSPKMSRKPNKSNESNDASRQEGECITNEDASTMTHYRVQLSPQDALHPTSPPSSSLRWCQGKLIGKGAFGSVYMGIDIRSGATIAIKRIHLDRAMRQNSTEWCSEINSLRKLDHPNIVNLLGVERIADELVILMEYVPGSSLTQHLRKDIGPLPEAVIRRYMKQLVSALAYCHANNVVHRDIKGSNILVDTHGNVKLADFGSAKFVGSHSAKNEPSQSYAYTPLWLAPEVITSGVYNVKVDIWSVGCVMIEMATAKSPWDECGFENPWQVMFHLGNSSDVPRIPTERLGAAAVDFLKQCLQRSPDKRPHARALLHHPFLVQSAVPE